MIFPTLQRWKCVNKLCKASIVTRVKNQGGTKFQVFTGQRGKRHNHIANLARVSSRLLINLYLDF